MRLWPILLVLGLVLMFAACAVPQWSRQVGASLVCQGPRGWSSQN